MIMLSQLLKLDGILSVTNEIKDIELDFATDTRKFETQNTFIALKGDKFDGFDYVEQVLDKNCYIVVFERSAKNSKHLGQIKKMYQACCFIEVEDIISFLHSIAHAVSADFYQRGHKVICISGSNGKTTTKEMVAYLLQGLGFNVVKTLSNNNNHIGVPLTLFQIKKNTEYAVVELGSNHPGEIPKLCEILDPHIGYTTNIGHTHLEFFDNLENVFKEEAYLYQAIKKSGKRPKLFLVNNFDEYLNTIDGPECVKLNNSDFILKADFNNCNITTNGKKYEINNANLTGKHNFFNIGAAIILVQQTTGKDFNQIIQVAKNFCPSNNRSQWLELKATKIFLDAYNANPSSMKEAIEGFYQTVKSESVPWNKVLFILGDMNELGSNAENFHHQLGEFMAEKGISNLWVVGRFGKNYREGFTEARIFDQTLDAKKVFQNEMGQFNYVFIKGSRSLQLETIIDIT